MGAATSPYAKKAEAFEKGYKPSDDDHPDLQSRVVMYRRAVKEGQTRTIEVHARTLVRFLEHAGVDIPKPAAKKAPAKKAADTPPPAPQS